MKSDFEIVQDRLLDLKERRRNIARTIDILNEKIVDIDVNNLVPRDAYLNPYLARGGNMRYYPYVKWRCKYPVFPVKNKDKLGKSKHISKVGDPRYIEAVDILLDTQRYYVVIEQIEVLYDIREKINAEIERLEALIDGILPPEKVPDSGAAVLGGELGRQIRWERYGI